MSGGLASEKADAYFGPMAMATPTDGTLASNVIRRPSANTNTSEALNTDTMADNSVKCPWQGKYVDIKNESPTDYLEIAFSIAAQTLVYGQQGTFAAGHAAAGWRLDPGQTISVIVPKEALYANWILASGAAASTVAFRLSEGNVGSR